jgi:hypothetical protein
VSCNLFCTCTVDCLLLDEVVRIDPLAQNDPLCFDVVMRFCLPVLLTLVLNYGLGAMLLDKLGNFLAMFLKVGDTNPEYYVWLSNFLGPLCSLEYFWHTEGILLLVLIAIKTHM